MALTSPRIRRVWMAACLWFFGCPPLTGALFEASSPTTPQPPTSPGVPAGTSLTPTAGPLVLEVDDAVVESLDVDGCVSITGARITFRNSRVRCGGDRIAIEATATTGTTITSVEVDGLSEADVGILCDACTVSWVDIHHANQGVRLGSNGTLEDSLIHALEDVSTGAGFSSGMYGVQSTGGTNIRVRRNAITPGDRAFGAVLMGADLAALSDVLVEDNVLDDGSFTVYAGSGQSFPATNVVIRRNRIGRGGDRGPKSLSTGVIWTDNVWDDTGEAIP